MTPAEAIAQGKCPGCVGRGAVWRVPDDRMAGCSLCGGTGAWPPKEPFLLRWDVPRFLARRPWLPVAAATVANLAALAQQVRHDWPAPAVVVSAVIVAIGAFFTGMLFERHR